MLSMACSGHLNKWQEEKEEKSGVCPKRITISCMVCENSQIVSITTKWCCCSITIIIHTKSANGTSFRLLAAAG